MFTVSPFISVDNVGKEEYEYILLMFIRPFQSDYQGINTILRVDSDKLLRFFRMSVDTIDEMLSKSEPHANEGER